jgi:hypothetical protein
VLTEEKNRNGERKDLFTSAYGSSKKYLATYSEKKRKKGKNVRAWKRY